MIRLEDGKYIIGFDDGYQLGKTANFIFNNGVHMLGSAEPTLKEHTLTRVRRQQESLFFLDILEMLKYFVIFEGNRKKRRGLGYTGSPSNHLNSTYFSFHICRKY